MVRALQNFVKGPLQGNKPYGIVRYFTSKTQCLGEKCRRSSGVERAIGNGEADSSILSGGTISQAPLRLTH